MSAIAEKWYEYETAHPVERGSKSAVCAAHDSPSYWHVAIELTHLHTVDKGDAGGRLRKLFFDESHAGGKLHHSNILEVCNADADGDSGCRGMGLVENAHTLDVAVRPDRRLSLRERTWSPGAPHGGG